MAGGSAGGDGGGGCVHRNRCLRVKAAFAARAATTAALVVVVVAVVGVVVVKVAVSCDFFLFAVPCLFPLSSPDSLSTNNPAYPDSFH